jgi:hypothetical protein
VQQLVSFEAGYVFVEEQFSALGCRIG